MRNIETSSQENRTDAAIVHSFNSMVVSRPYDDIHVSDIIREAGVGRSTFYEHFRNKDDVLRRSVRRVLEPLADLVTSNVASKQIEFILNHFWDNRRMARQLLRGSSSGPLMRVHAELIAERLNDIGRATGNTTIIAIPLASMQIAEAQFGLVRAWLEGAGECTINELATALLHSTNALVKAHTN